MIDQVAMNKFGHQFTACSPAEQTALLTELAAQENSPEPAPVFFRSMKTLTAAIYYSTPEGYRDLTKYGPPPKSFGCNHASEHIA